MKVLSEVGAVTLDESYPGDRGYLAFAALSAPAVLVAAVELRSTW